jgi:hypothetical protein
MMRSACALLTFVLAACDAGARRRDVDLCVERGVAYFKEIGSYPTLTAPPNAGRAAVTVVIERCSRTTAAF